MSAILRQNEQPDRGGKAGVRAPPRINFRGEGVQRLIAGQGNLTKGRPEFCLQRHTGAMAFEGQRAFDRAGHGNTFPGATSQRLGVMAASYYTRFDGGLFGLALVVVENGARFFGARLFQ